MRTSSMVLGCMCGHSKLTTFLQIHCRFKNKQKLVTSDPLSLLGTLIVSLIAHLKASSHIISVGFKSTQSFKDKTLYIICGWDLTTYCGEKTMASSSEWKIKHIYVIGYIRSKHITSAECRGNFRCF